MRFTIARAAKIETMDAISIRCPVCKHQGTLTSLGIPTDVQIQDGTRLGQRRCPNPKCLSHVFIAWRDGSVLVSYPAESIDFDNSSIPQAVSKALEEAIICHSAKCFTAAAIMVRKSLEELCRDRGAVGDSLKDRLQSLRSKVVLPEELLEGLDDLRLLGNDAAHVESLVYSQVGQEEVEVGIEFAKEVLKAVYQYAHLLGRLRALKKSP